MPPVQDKTAAKPLRRGSRLGQYRIEAKLAAGHFAEVYRAYDTVEGIRVALKLPLGELVDSSTLANFRREVRMVAQLDHPAILPIKTAGTIDGRFAIVTPLGIENLSDRMLRRMTRTTKTSFARQLVEALAHAHRRRIAHLDVKPDNLILFPEGRLRLADFGLARVAQCTLSASGSGTLGYLAPEQALGKPSLRSDVFAAGLVIHRLFTGKLPSWPFEWPFRGHEKLEEGWHPEVARILRRSLQVDERKRWASAVPMLAALERIGARAVR
jgi:serine/threonine-protein kinase